ncbi:MAG: hypothetical protein M1450_02015, partial [Patescibacteria group bacterium]|nr:hypothetical protein [Patescibacteria group bacterium]
MERLFRLPKREQIRNIGIKGGLAVGAAGAMFVASEGIADPIVKPGINTLQNSAHVLQGQFPKLSFKGLTLRSQTNAEAEALKSQVASRAYIAYLRKDPPKVQPPEVKPNPNVLKTITRPSGGAFVDTEKQREVYMRGFNLIDLCPNNAIWWHCNFIDSHYNAQDMENVYSDMSNRGYNAVRVFITPEVIDPSGQFSESYIKNFVEDLRISNKYKIFKTITLNTPIVRGKYMVLYDNPDFAGINRAYFSPEGVSIASQFTVDFLKEVLQAGGPDILRYSLLSLTNEMEINLGQVPFTKQGIVRAANGKEYKLPDEAEKLKVEGEIYWTNQVIAAVRTVDPTISITVGGFFRNAAKQWDPNREGIVPEMLLTPQKGGPNTDYNSPHRYMGVNNFTAEQELGFFREKYSVEDITEKPTEYEEWGAYKYIKGFANGFRDAISVAGTAVKLLTP